MKPQFTEEEARELAQSITCNKKCIASGICLECRIESIRNAGYIRKSDLEILIEEAEEEMRKFSEHDPKYKEASDLFFLINILHGSFQAMKAELNKRRDI